MSSLFLSVLRSKAWVWWIPTTVYTSNQALILTDRLHGCLLCIPMRNWSAACRRLKGCETLWLTQTCHPASKTTIQHSSARKHDVFYEAGLGSQVFLEATFSERKQVGLCEGRKKKTRQSFHQSCFSHANAYFSILLSYAACHLWCLQLTWWLVWMSLLSLTTGLETTTPQAGSKLICSCSIDWQSQMAKSASGMQQVMHLPVQASL